MFRNVSLINKRVLHNVYTVYTVHRVVLCYLCKTNHHALDCLQPFVEVAATIKVVLHTHKIQCFMQNSSPGHSVVHECGQKQLTRAERLSSTSETRIA